MDACYASLMVGALVMEGMGRQLNSNLNLFDIARPVIWANLDTLKLNVDLNFKDHFWLGTWLLLGRVMALIKGSQKTD